MQDLINILLRNREERSRRTVNFVNKAGAVLFQIVSPNRPKPYLARFSDTNMKDIFDFAFVTKYFLYNPLGPV